MDICWVLGFQAFRVIVSVVLPRNMRSQYARHPLYGKALADTANAHSAKAQSSHTAGVCGFQNPVIWSR
jgi:hypothetical protein